VLHALGHLHHSQQGYVYAEGFYKRRIDIFEHIRRQYHGQLDRKYLQELKRTYEDFARMLKARNRVTEHNQAKDKADAITLD
jgi:hypothetical protein